MTTFDGLIERLTRPIIGIENRTAQEAFDIMADRIRGALSAYSVPEGRPIPNHPSGGDTGSGA
jgi:hypothetical protein